MGKRSAFWIGGIAIVATLGGVAAYAALHPAMLGPVLLNSAGPTASADTVRRASRIDGDMRATFERLEKSGAPKEDLVQPRAAGPVPVAPPPVAVAAPYHPVVASPPPEAAGPVVLAKPAKGMPVSLVPGQQRASGEAPRVMDPRMTKALDLLANSAPRATVAALPEAPVVAGQPVAAEQPVAAPMAAIAAKNESDMTAEELNAREHRRIRQSQELVSGGTN